MITHTETLKQEKSLAEKAQEAWNAWAKSGDPDFKLAQLAGNASNSTKSLDVPQASDEDSELPEISDIVQQTQVDWRDIVIDEIGHLIPEKSHDKVRILLNSCTEEVKESVSQGSSELADYGLRLLQVLGQADNRELRMRSQILLAIISRDDANLAQIAREHRLTRAATSKIAQEIKSRLGIKIHTTTRDEKYVEQCRQRALRIHANRRSSQN